MRIRFRPCLRDNQAAGRLALVGACLVPGDWLAPSWALAAAAPPFDAPPGFCRLAVCWRAVDMQKPIMPMKFSSVDGLRYGGRPPGFCHDSKRLLRAWRPVWELKYIGITVN